MSSSRPLSIIVLTVFAFGGASMALANDGDLDAGFNHTGVALVPTPPAFPAGATLFVQADGKIVASTPTSVFRLNGDGSLDSSFGASGVVVLPVTVKTLSLQADGKILVGGGNPHMTIGRLNPDGSPDGSFGSGGYASTNLYGATTAYALVVQADGKIVAAGVASASPFAEFALARFNSDGTLDTGFGAGGVTVTAFSANSAANSLVLLSDGRLVAAGSDCAGGYDCIGSASGRFALARYSASGSLDPTFGTSGLVETTFGGGAATARSLALQSDGRLVAAGVFRAGVAAWSIALARYDDDGSLDPAFGTGGQVITTVGRYCLGESLVIQPDGRLVVAGVGEQTVLVRYNGDGSLDAGFGNGGAVYGEPGFSLGESGSSLALDASGGFVIAGSELCMAAVQRFDPAGARDGSFGASGVPGEVVGAVIPELFYGEFSSVGSDVRLDSNGRIVLAGTTGTLNGSDFGLVRHNADGAFDATFGAGGGVVTALPGGSDDSRARAILVQPDGRIVAAGSALSGPSALQLFVARYDESGVLDPGFGIGGESTMALPGSFHPHAAALQADGKILVVGEEENPPGTLPTFRVALVRLDADGAPDTTFGNGGLVEVASPDGGLQARAVSVQSNGEILVAGTTFDPAELDGFAVYRFNPDGSPDLAFGVAGRAAAYLPGSNAQAQSLGLQTDGKIVVGGNGVTLGVSEFLVARFDSVGRLDLGFGSNGFAAMSFPGLRSGSNALAIQSDGRVVIAGWCDVPAFRPVREFALARLLADGTPDATFGTGGEVTTNLSSGFDSIASIAIQSNGYIVAAGSSSACVSAMALARYVVQCPTISISPPSLPVAVVADPYSSTVAADGGAAPYSMTLSSGSLPPGIAFNSTTGVLSGTPTHGGTYPFTVAATDANGCVGLHYYELRVVCLATITLSPSTLPSGSVGTAYSQTITASGGGGGYTFSVGGGSLPPGLSLSAGGLVSGTPTALGVYSFVVTATDSQGCFGSSFYTISISCAGISVSPTSLPNAEVGTVYNQTISASGGTGTYTFSSTGTLPAGTSLDPTTGVLSGTLTAVGSYSFTVLATDGNGCTGSQSYLVTVSCAAINITPSSLPSGVVGTAYNQTFVPNGGVGPYTITATGTLPPGLSLSSGGVLSGTPTTAGTFSFVVTATDSEGCFGSAFYTVTISCAAITVSPAGLPNAQAGVPYSQTISASGGSGSYSFSVSGILPPGLSLNSSTGVLSGTPTTMGNYLFTVTATDTNGCTGSQIYLITVSCAAVNLSPASLPGGNVGLAYSQTITASGGSAPYTFAASGSLPPGVSLSASGVLSGTPTAAGTYTFEVTATDSNGCAGTFLYTVTIGQAGAQLHYYTIAPCRLVDTRPGSSAPFGGPQLGSNETRSWPWAGNCGVPSDAVAVSANVTAPTTTANGTLVFYPAGVPVPQTTTIFVKLGRVRANNAEITMSGPFPGVVSVTSNIPGGSTNVIVDVSGYYR